jgi:predicted regulator of Ras-like GTPase activity (Roadblock/LC7/MglB family)
VIVERESARGRKARQEQTAAAAAESQAETLLELAISEEPEAAPNIIGRQLNSRQLDEIDRILADLRLETQARCLLLVEGSGHVIDAKGVIEDINISALAALVAGDFAATSGIASVIGEGDSFRLNYHEGARYSIYLAHLTKDVFLLIVFGQEVKSGLVLYATRQALPHLQSILSTVEPLDEDLQEEIFSLAQIPESELMSDKIFSTLDEQFKNLWK